MTEILTRQGVSEFLKMPVRTIDYLVQTGQIPFTRPGKRLVRFNKFDIEAWLEDRKNIEYRMPRNSKGL
ncbi:MAG: helix-turn-helix domain-containing protein [Desulfobacteraceae bacterium]|nr:helix-turn-helix domain-containing protein [Desulfobacteraceae bacterium]